MGLKVQFDAISEPKNVCLTTETKDNCLVLLQIITPVQSNCRLVPLARDRVGRNGLKLEKCVANVFQVFVFLSPKCARTEYELFLSRIELISLLSLFWNYFVAK